MNQKLMVGLLGVALLVSLAVAVISGPGAASKVQTSNAVGTPIDLPAEGGSDCSGCPSEKPGCAEGGAGCPTDKPACSEGAGQCPMGGGEQAPAADSKPVEKPAEKPATEPAPTN
ncbi:MAG: hypothetical protein IT204_06295 [Fimbriimonadaceae bacterium]|nr:hypothetical protein [Fimbriimonadaceae bacterium]